MDVNFGEVGLATGDPGDFGVAITGF
jgi:hypothetical protein